MLKKRYVNSSDGVKECSNFPLKTPPVNFVKKQESRFSCFFNISIRIFIYFSYIRANISDFLTIMDFLSAFLAYALSLGYSESDALVAHSNYCQNLYWQENAIEKMELYGCDIKKTSTDIYRVKSGKY